MMSTTAQRIVALTALFVLLGIVGAPAQDLSTDSAPPIFNEAIDRYEAGQFEQALVTFRELLSQDSYERLHGDAYFWIAKSAIALGRLNEAADNLEFFLANYPDNPYYVEGAYENGRLLYLQGDYEQSIRALEAFVNEHPQSPFVANSYYWIGESLFALGHFDRAEQAFRTVTEQYPRSYRAEPAQYRLSIIDLRRREEELLKLLQWSHEEYVKAVEEFQEREQSFEAAISDYQRQISEDRQLSLQSEVQRLTQQQNSLRQEVQQKDTRIDDLTAEIQNLRDRLSEARATASEAERQEPTSAAPAREGELDALAPSTRALVAAKERALELKEFFVRELLRNAEVGQ